MVDSAGRVGGRVLVAPLSFDGSGQASDGRELGSLGAGAQAVSSDNKQQTDRIIDRIIFFVKISTGLRSNNMLIFIFSIFIHLVLFRKNQIVSR
jgi:hypothetical protein